MATISYGGHARTTLLYTFDAADDLTLVILGDVRLRIND